MLLLIEFISIFVAVSFVVSLAFLLIKIQQKLGCDPTSPWCLIFDLLVFTMAYLVIKSLNMTHKDLEDKGKKDDL